MTFLGNKQFSEYEFEMLARAGSSLVEKMILQRVRVDDRMANFDIVGHALDYVEVNVRDKYYIKREYQSISVYFVDPIDSENLSAVLNDYAKNNT